MKKIVSVLLLLAMLVLPLASCGGKKGTETEATAGETEPASAAPGTTAEATTAEATLDPKWDEVARSVRIIIEKDRTLKIELSNHSDAEKTSKNDKYVVGPDEVVLGATPKIEQLVYERNKAACDLLQVKPEYTYWDYAWSKQAEQIKTVVQGNASDAPDLFVNMISDLNVANLNGVFKDIRSIPNSFFDFEADGWMSDYMNSLSLTGDRSYVLAGDYFLDILRALGVIPVNVTMMNANAEKLAPAILSEDDSLGTGEQLSTRFFDFVEEGKWTWDVLGKLCEAIWVDENNDGQDSITDVLGIVADNHGGLTSEMYIFSASEDDLFVNMIYDLNVATLSGVFKDVRSIPGSFFDFEADGWMTDYMNSLSLTGDRGYVLAGDYFLDVLRALGVLPVNITMMDANADKLAPVILSEDDPLGTGEQLSTRFFDFVEEGKWTWDVLGKLCEAIWVDENNDGQDSITDVLGIVADNHGGLTSEMYIFSASEDDLFDVKRIEDASSPYNDKDWIYYSEDPTALGRIFDAVAAVYAGKGSVGTKNNYEGSTPENPGATYHRIKFAEGTLLTAGTVVLGALEDEQFQQMEDLFTVVPLPKISEEKHYNTCIHTIGDAGAINVHANPRKARAISAFLQYNCENSAEIRREFLETVMKYKTTVYNQGTDRMLDIIYDSVITGRDKMIEDVIGGNNRFIIIMRNGNCEVTSSDLASAYQSAVPLKQSTLDEIIRTWYALPRVEPAGE